MRPLCCLWLSGVLSNLLFPSIHQNDPTPHPTLHLIRWSLCHEHAKACVPSQHTHNHNYILTASITLWLIEVSTEYLMDRHITIYPASNFFSALPSCGSLLSQVLTEICRLYLKGACSLYWKNLVTLLTVLSYLNGIHAVSWCPISGLVLRQWRSKPPENTVLLLRYIHNMCTCICSLEHLSRSGKVCCQSWQE